MRRFRQQPVQGGQRIRLKRQHHQRGDVARGDHVFDVIDLLAGVGRRGKDEIQTGIHFLEALDGFLGVEVHTAGPAMCGGRNGHANDFDVVLCECSTADSGRQCSGDKCLCVFH